MEKIIATEEKMMEIKTRKLMTKKYRNSSQKESLILDVIISQFLK